MKSEKLLKINEYLADRGVSISEDDRGLFLAYKDMILRADFTEMLGRIAPGALAQELIVKASGINKGNHRLSPLAIDATAGLGEDSLLLAAAGFRVMLYEKDEIIFSLLKDAYERAMNLPNNSEYAILKSAVSRMDIYNDDSIKAMLDILNWTDKQKSRTGDSTIESSNTYIHPDVIFLDPMFPERKKSSLVGKKLQILQQLEAPCDNEVELLDAAMALMPKRIIIKRPPKGPYLCGKKPTFSLSGRSVRIDCIIL